MAGSTFDYIAPKYNRISEFSKSDPKHVPIQFGEVVDHSVDLWGIGAVFVEMTPPKSPL